MWRSRFAVRSLSDFIVLAAALWVPMPKVQRTFDFVAQNFTAVKYRDAIRLLNVFLRSSVKEKLRFRAKPLTKSEIASELQLSNSSHKLAPRVKCP